MGVGGVDLNLLTQPADVDIHGAAVTHVLVAPHLIEQLLTGEDLALIEHQESQQLELTWLEVEFHTVAGSAVLVRVNIEVGDTQDAAFRANRFILDLGAGAGGFVAAQQCLDPRQQFTQAKRLSHVIIGPKFEANHLVNLLIAGSKHDDRHVALAA